MEIRYNVTGAKRKELVKVIADATGARAEYKFMLPAIMRSTTSRSPRTGRLLFDDRADSEEVEQVLETIAAAGFECEAHDARNCPPKKNPKPSTLRHRTKLWGLWWKSHWTRWRLATSPSYWTPRAVSSKGARRGHSAHRDSGRPGGIPLVPGTAGCRLGQSLHPLHLRTLRDEQKRQAGNGHGEKQWITRNTPSAAFSCAWASSAANTRRSAKSC